MGLFGEDKELLHEGYYREIGLCGRDMELFGEDMGLLHEGYYKPCSRRQTDRNRESHRRH